MKTETIIQSITVGQNLQQTYSVGDEIDGRVVIEIKSYVDSRGVEYHLLDEDGEAIVHVNYLPSIEKYTQIAVDGPPEQ